MKRLICTVALGVSVFSLIFALTSCSVTIDMNNIPTAAPTVTGAPAAESLPKTETDSGTPTAPAASAPVVSIPVQPSVTNMPTAPSAPVTDTPITLPNPPITTPKPSIGGESSDKTENTPPVSSHAFHRMSELELFKTIPSEVGSTLCDSYTDGVNNYFYYHIGKIENVPIYYSDIQSHKSESQTISITSAHSISSMLQKTTSVCIEEAISDTLGNTKGISGTLGKEDIASVSVSHAASESKTTSLLSSVGKEFTESLTFSITNSTSNELTLSSDDQAGEYRYIQLATFDVYAVLVCELDTKTCRYEYLTSVKRDSISSGWYYGSTRGEMQIPDRLDANAEKLGFDVSALKHLDLYTPVGEERLLRRMTAHSDKDYYVSYWKGTTYKIWLEDCSPIYNSDAVSALGLTHVRITVNYTVKASDGKCKTVAKLYSEVETIAKKSKNVEGTKTLTMEAEMTYEAFLQHFVKDKKIYTSFQAEKSSALDLVDNHYHITDYEMIVELY